jgi:hypothetical protein
LSFKHYFVGFLVHGSLQQVSGAKLPPNLIVSIVVSFGTLPIILPSPEIPHFRDSRFDKADDKVDDEADDPRRGALPRRAKLATKIPLRVDKASIHGSTKLMTKIYPKTALNPSSFS